MESDTMNYKELSNTFKKIKQKTEVVKFKNYLCFTYTQKLYLTYCCSKNWRECVGIEPTQDAPNAQHWF